jgi:hypothetical protein
MLVLLIIFLITVPVIVKQIPVQLPNARNIPTITKPENIVIAVDADGLHLGIGRALLCAARAWASGYARQRLDSHWPRPLHDRSGN